jgi:hypothetical protein
MPIDSILRAIGVLTCVYTIGLFVTLMSTAAIEVASHHNLVPCTDGSCVAVAHLQDHHAAPIETAEPGTLLMAALFVARSLE